MKTQLQRKIISLILATILILALVPVIAVGAQETEIMGHFNKSTKIFTFEPDTGVNVTFTNAGEVQAEFVMEMFNVHLITASAPTTITLTDDYSQKKLGFGKDTLAQNGYNPVGLLPSDFTLTKYIGTINLNDSLNPFEWDKSGVTNEVSVPLSVDKKNNGMYEIGSAYTITEPGFYKLSLFCGYVDEVLYINVVGGTSATPTTATLTAKPTASKVLVNGKDTAFDAYTIDGNNYFKLRDLAYILNGTAKQFEVGFDNATQAITLTGGKAYTAVGGEMAASKSKGNKTPTATSSKIYLNGKEVSFTAYNIDGNNYFKLRDLMKALDIYVGYDDKTKTITLDTSKGYVD